MNKLRTSIVQYLNTAPLVWGFTNGPLRGKYELSFTVPSQCAEALRSGAADLAIIPAIEVQRIDGLVVLPDLAIACKKQVRSLLIVSKKPIEKVQSLVLDSSSRSTQALTRILCAELWKITPTFFELAPDPASMLQKADAALLIGDPALRISLAIENKTFLDGQGDLVCKAADAGIPKSEQLYVYDIVEEWRRLTGLPAVLAVWAAKENICTPEVAADFIASREFGVARVHEIADAASLEMKLPAASLVSYLLRNIDFSMDAENQRGLQHYYERAAALGLITGVKPIHWAVAGKEREKVRASS